LKFISTEVSPKLLLDSPGIVLLAISLICAFFAFHAKDFGLDASADSLVLENNRALRYYRSIRARYGSDDYLIVTYTPKADLFTRSTLDDLQKLRDDLRALEAVESVTSILDVPLLESPPVSLEELRDNIRTLEDPSADISRVRKELTANPLYKNRLISPDGATTALRANLHRDEKYHALLRERNRLREKRLQEGLTDREGRRLSAVTSQFKRYNDAKRDILQENIAAVRAAMDEHRDRAELHLGGVPMIVADSILFIRHDLIAFGSGVLGFLVVILTVTFRKIRWVLLPMVTCFAAGVIMIGFLGLVGWPVTVVSANFVSLLLIVTLSLTVHLIVFYREEHALRPQADQRSLVLETIRHKFLPCLYTALTTVVAFGSLLFSGIRPVIDFGWMMTVGIVVAFALSFTLFPAALMFFEPGQPPERRNLTAAVTSLIAMAVERQPTAILYFFAFLAVAGVAGMYSLSVENRFIDYYKESTEIYQGMELIDRKLGGTTPLDVIVDAPQDFEPPTGRENDDPFADEFEGGGITTTSYWFNTFRLEEAEKIHSALDRLPATGKVLSIATFMKMARKLEEHNPIDTFFLAILYKKMPEKIKKEMIFPYMSEDGNQLRFSIRVYESDPSLRRDELLATIRDRLIEKLGLAPERVHLTGMLALYNDMLQSLFHSLILTSGFVFLAVMLMFAILFRSLKLAAVAIVPNLVAAAVVLGIMGWLGISLDIMTVAIAAICIGIAVDDTIHYVHRIRVEYDKTRNYRQAIRNSHASIGRALFYTTACITLGFSILTLSNFVPTIYFGLLTGVSMLIALLADMTLLPLLIAKFRVLD